VTSSIRKPKLNTSLRFKLSLSVAIFVFASNLFLLILDTLALDPTPDGFLLQFDMQSRVVLAITLLTALVSYNLSWQLLKPLGVLNQQLSSLNSRQFSSQDFHAEAHEDHEIQTLRASFRNLLGNIEKDQQRRETFIAMLVHDLKTPLLAQGYLLEMIAKNDALGKEERLQIVNQLNLENSRVTDLLQKIIDTYKLEYHDLQLNQEYLPLSGVVDNVLQRTQYIAQQRNIQVMVRPSEVSLMIDPKEVERALYNLVSNGLRYAKTQVVLELDPLGIYVEDDGPGLAASLEDLSQPFNSQPVLIAGERYSAGVGGLGLFIAKTIAEAHGGSLTQEPSEKGLKLFLRLP
jgi:signal transduction histidine kinase